MLLWLFVIVHVSSNLSVFIDLYALLFGPSCRIRVVSYTEDEVRSVKDHSSIDGAERRWVFFNPLSNHVKPHVYLPVMPCILDYLR